MHFIRAMKPDLVSISHDHFNKIELVLYSDGISKDNSLPGKLIVEEIRTLLATFSCFDIPDSTTHSI